MCEGPLHVQDKPGTGTLGNPGYGTKKFQHTILGFVIHTANSLTKDRAVIPSFLDSQRFFISLPSSTFKK